MGIIWFFSFFFAGSVDSRACPKCAKLFLNKSMFESHRRTCGLSAAEKMALKRYSCEHCFYKSDNKKCLSNHIQAAHSRHNLNLRTCERCNRCYASPICLKAHQRRCGKSLIVRNVDKVLSCDECNYRTYSKAHLVRHIHGMHFPQDSDLNSCNRCGKRFLQRGNLRSHLKVCNLTEEEKLELCRFMCDVCGKKFSHKLNLSLHMSGVHAWYQCRRCKKSFRRFVNFEVHTKKCLDAPVDACESKVVDVVINPWKGVPIQEIKRNVSTTECHKCGKSFGRPLNLRKHLKLCGLTKDEKDVLKVFGCEKCDSKFTSKNILDGHVKNVHSKNKCGRCRKVFDAEEDLLVHLKTCVKLNASSTTSKTSDFSCGKCGKNFNSRQGMSRHLKLCGLSEDQKNALKFQCSDCERKFTQVSALYNHKRTVHGKNSCGVCKKVFKNEVELSNHLKVCVRSTKSEQVKCPKCSSVLLRKGSLLKHLKTCGLSKAEKVASRRFACDHCDYKSDSKPFLVDHIERVHLKVKKTVKCKICGKTISISSKIFHERICGQSEDVRQAMKRFECDLCKYRTNMKNVLIAHMKSMHLPVEEHLNECVKCGKGYARKDSLKLHAKVCGLTKKERAEVLYVSCSVCDKKLSSKYTLATHTRNVHEPRKCAKCGELFSRKEQLMVHSKFCK